MGYESRLYVMRKSNATNWGEVLAMVNLYGWNDAVLESRK